MTLSLWLTLSAPLAAMAREIAPICEIDPSGETLIVSEQLEVGEDLVNELVSFQDTIKAAGQTATQLRDQLLVLTTRANTPQLQTTFTQLTTQQKTLTQQSARLLQQIPKAYRAERQNTVIALMRLNTLLVQVETLLKPYDSTLSQLQQHYSLALTTEQFDEIYPLGLDLPEGLSAKTEKTKTQKQQYRLVLSNESIFRAQTRAAAQSFVTRNSGRAYMETARCTLNRLILGKLTLNHALVGDNNQPLPIAASTRVCLNTTAGEILKMSQQDARQRQENSLRGVISQQLPSMFHGLPKTTLSYLEENQLSEHLAQLRVFPENLNAINFQRSQAKLPELNEQEVVKALTEINADLDLQFQKWPALQTLKHLWNDDRLISALMPLLSDCRFNFASSLNEENLIVSLPALLAKSEDFYFINNLAFDLSLMQARLTEMDEAQVHQTLKDYITSRRRAATYQALINVLGQFHAPASADLELWLAAAQDQLTPIINTIIQERWQNSQLEAYTRQLTQAALSQQTQARSMQLLLDNFSSEMIIKSKMIEPYLNPETPLKELPYDESAMIRAINPTIAQMSAQRISFLQIIIGEKDSSRRQKLWGSLEADVTKEIKSKNFKCEATGGMIHYFGQLADRHVINRQTPERTRSADDQLKNDCFRMQIIKSALNLGQQYPAAQNYADVDSRLSKILGAKELKGMALAYRQALADPVMGEYRLLDQKHAESSTLIKTKKMYQYLAAQSEQNPAAVRATIVAAVKKSIANLNDLLKVSANANTPQDLNFFITRTRVLNTVFGENDLNTYVGLQNGIFATEQRVSDLMQSAGFVFPQLIIEHQKVQNEMVAREDLNHEVMEEFIGANGMIVMGVLGGWVVKHALGIMPRWFFGAPYLGAGIDKLGANTINLISGHGWYFLSLMAIHIPTLEFKIKQYNNDIKNISELTAAETLKPEGAENPIPLIEWDEYRNQYNLFKSRIKAARWGQAQDLFWIVLAGSQNMMVRKGTSHVAKGTNRLNVRMEKMSSSERTAYAAWLKFRYRHKLALLKSDLRVLKNPEHLDASSLLANYNRLYAVAKSPAQRAKLDRAYERIVTKLGSPLENIIANPQLKELHAKSLFGPQGTAQQIDDLYMEYIRIMQKQSAAVGL